MYIRVLPNI
uniref:Uncharacterized protein n=1 Tax=Arundo donax TaxID=35708 RepID=A0A0A9AC77_ARUDO